METIDEYWDPEKETGYRIERRLCMTRRVILESRTSILNQFKAELLTTAIKNWHQFMTQIESTNKLWDFFGLKRRVYNKTNMDYFILKRAYPSWSVEEQKIIIDEILEKIKTIPMKFKRLQNKFTKTNTIEKIPDILFWGCKLASYPDFYSKCACCLREVSNGHQHRIVQQNDEMGFRDDQKSCFCERNLAILVPCGHAVCADTCYSHINDTSTCLLCRANVKRVLFTQKLRLPPLIMQRLSLLG